MFANGEQRPRSVKQHVCSYVYLMHFVIPFGQGKRHLQPAALPRRRSFPCPHEMRGVGASFWITLSFPIPGDA